MYSSLFHISDMSDRGYLDRVEVDALLICAKLPPDIKEDILKALEEAVELFSSPIGLEDWLIICKFVASYQSLGKLDTKAVLSWNSNDLEQRDKGSYNGMNAVADNLAHTKLAKRTLADFGFNDHNLTPSIPNIVCGSSEPEYIEIKSEGWGHGTKGRENYFVYKFKIRTNMQMFALSEWSIERRYSDFDLFCNSFMKDTQLGAILSPIPPKYFAVNETIARQRARDLTLFLVNVTKQPRLRQVSAHVLYTSHRTLYTVHSSLYTVHSSLYTVHSSLYTVQCILYTVHSSLYTV